MKTLAILVGGGPAPGINAVIAAATIEARNRGLRVLGCEAGFKWLMQGDLSRVHELDIAGVSQIHFEGGSILRTARANPTRSPEALQHVVESLRRLDVSYLLTIGGDDTAFGTSRVARALERPDGGGPRSRRPSTTTFLCRPRSPPSASRRRWTGHGAGPESDEGRGHDRQVVLRDGDGPPCRPSRARDRRGRRRHPHRHRRGVSGGPVPIRAAGGHPGGAIIKRRPSAGTTAWPSLPRVSSRSSTRQTLGTVERDAYGNVRLEELELARLLKTRVARALRARGIGTGIVAKDLGYELRCAPPAGFDIQYCRSLGYWADALPARRRHRSDGDDPGRQARSHPVRGSDSTPRTGRSAFATWTSTRRRTGRFTRT